jgi:hypothetical protein
MVAEDNLSTGIARSPAIREITAVVRKTASNPKKSAWIPDKRVPNDPLANVKPRIIPEAIPIFPGNKRWAMITKMLCGMPVKKPANNISTKA